MNKLIKQKLGQFYTTNSDYIVGNLLDDLPHDALIVDPFAGDWDLLRVISNNVMAGYDIDPQNTKTIRQDTLLSPPNYEGRWVVTNPPYLARNKNKDKDLYNLYDTDDLYKVAIKTIIGCEGGIIIVPLNFFSSNDSKIRKEFFSKYEILKLNIFEEQVFQDTSYTVCAFSFKKGGGIKHKIDTTFFPSKQKKSFTIMGRQGYMIGSPFLSKVKVEYDVSVGRLVGNNKANSYITKLMLYAIDTGSMNGRIRLEYGAKPFYAKISDRTFATITISKKISDGNQEIIANQFNEMLEGYRKKYNSLFLTNFRNSTTEYARKRIDFRFAYNIIKYIMFKNNI